MTIDMATDQYLTGGILLRAALPLLALLLLLVLNIRLAILRRKSLFLAGVHLSSLFLGFSLTGRLLSTVTFALPVEAIWIAMQRAGWMAALLCGGMTMGLSVVLRKLKYEQTRISPVLRDAFLSMDDVILTYAYDGHFLETNHPDQLHRWFSDPIDTLDRLEAQLVPLMEPEVHENVRSALLKGTSIAGINSRRDPDIHPLMLSISPLYAGADDRVGLVVLLHNVGERTRMMQQIESQNQHLQRLNHQLSEEMAALQPLETEKARLRLLEALQPLMAERLDAASAGISAIRRDHARPMPQRNAMAAKIASDLRAIYQDVRLTLRGITSQKEGVAHDQGPDC